MKWLITLLLFVSLSAVARDDIRLEDGSLLRVDDTKMAVLSKLGFPDAQQAGVFFY